LSAEPQLPLVRTRLIFQCKEQLRLPAHAGFAWRGAFGSALKRTVCAMRMRPCQGCMLSASCIYPYVFETPPPATAERMTRYERVPNPFCLYAGPIAMRVCKEGDALPLELTIFGHASRHLGYFLRAFEIAGEHGLTARRVPVALMRAERLPLNKDGEPETIYEGNSVIRLPQSAEVLPPPCPGRVVVRIFTPLRLKEAGNLVAPERFAARHLLSSLVRRVSMLMYFHGENALAADFQQLKRLAQGVEIFAQSLRWVDLVRSSSRQRTLMQMGGIVGSVGLDLCRAEALWPYLWLGQYIQAGRGTTMGLGHYRLATPGEPDL
jgi:hypothetical protein